MKDFNINDEEKAKKIIVFISTAKSSLGKWSELFVPQLQLPQVIGI
jgi:hypothetical protein